MEAKVQPYGMADDLDRVAVPALGRRLLGSSGRRHQAIVRGHPFNLTVPRGECGLVRQRRRSCRDHFADPPPITLSGIKPRTFLRKQGQVALELLKLADAGSD